MDDKTQSNKNLRVVIIAHLLIIIVTLGILFFSNSLKISASNGYILWRFISIFTFCWVVWSWKKIKTALFNPYGLFLLAVFLFNLSYVLLSLVPGNGQTSIANIFPMDIATSTIIVVNLSIIGLHLGALLAVAVISKLRSEKSFSFSDKDLTIVGYFLILISLYPLYLITRGSIQVSIAAGYSSLYRQVADTGILAGPAILASFIIPGIFLLLAGSKKSQTNRLISLIIIICYTAAQLVLGKRSTAIMPLVAYIWLWHKTIKPIKVGLLAVLGSLFLFIIFPIIRASRDLSGADKFSWHSISSLIGSTNPLLDALNEMGASVQITSHTIQLIPHYRHFDWGISYLYSLTTILPNLFWKIHPAMAHGTMSAWLISIVDPGLARLGQGLGFSFIAEAYANFGTYGALPMTIIIGFLFVAFSEYVEKSNNRGYLAAMATYLSFFLFFARAESSDIIRPFFWYAVMPIFFVLFIQKYRSKLFIKI